MNLDKLDIPLVMAFGLTEGPFSVVVNGQEIRVLSKEEILDLSGRCSIVSIELDRRLSDRRWRDR